MTQQGLQRQLTAGLCSLCCCLASNPNLPRRQNFHTLACSPSSCLCSSPASSPWVPSRRSCRFRISPVSSIRSKHNLKTSHKVIIKKALFKSPKIARASLFLCVPEHQHNTHPLYVILFADIVVRWSFEEISTPNIACLAARR